jgi:quercetin dioxygenase-like cupin family protein
MIDTPFEVWQDPQTKVIFYFSYSDENLTTGVMEIPAGAELPKHNRPKAFENLVQVSGRCLMKVFDGNDNPTEHILEAGDTLRMEKGQYHIHSNPYSEPSYTLFKAEGDITEIMKVLRSNFTRLGNRDNG